MIGNNDILTQEEIKSLIELSHNRADLDKLASSPIITDRNYTTYDFTNPFTISKEQHQAFEALHIEMIRDIAYELSANLRKRANIEIKSIEQISYGEYALNVPESTSFGTISILPLEGVLPIEVDLLISQKMIAELLGNGDSFNIEHTKPALTQLEVSVLEYFFNLTLKHMESAWDNIMSINFHLQGIEANAHNLHSIASHELSLLVVSTIQIDDVEGNFTICYPVVYIQSLLDKITKITDTSFARASRKDDFNVLMSGSKMNVDVIMAETFLNTKEILTLKPEDIIMFNKNANDSKGKVYINYKEKFVGVIGELNRKKAIQIQDIVDKENVKTLTKLAAIGRRRQRESEEQERIRQQLIRDKLQKKIDAEAQKIVK